ncbi:hypothetical protein Scep_022795 [Stephania cephalantha]|uniref:RNase H type-1 domain-containing protein n=1 Tax=Stephania cephalantha TaxID=152367 RepID=A0AAP0F631_9MAGN
MWKFRNNKVWKKRDVPIRKVVDDGLYWLECWKIARKPHDQNPSSRNGNHERVSWAPPPEGALKCNVDAAVFSNEHIIDMGACLRDSQGAFIKGMSKSMVGMCNPTEAEAIAFREALSWVHQQCQTKVIFELDAR